LPAENGKPENIATAVTEVSERVTLLIRDEIELAKAEVMGKVTKLARGAAIGAAAGVFGIFAFIYLLSTVAWGLNSVLGSVWEGFAIVLLVLVLLTVAGGLIAYRLLRVGPPVPTLAIDEAQKIRATMTGAPDGRTLEAARPQSETPVASTPEEKKS
jgi:uncharacterized small protein (DUF1192 family)